LLYPLLNRFQIGFLPLTLGSTSRGFPQTAQSILLRASQGLFVTLKNLSDCWRRLSLSIESNHMSTITGSLRYRNGKP
jgi:hypothetical protein